MAVAPKSTPRLQVALLESEPIRVQGFLSLFHEHPRIELVYLDLPRLLADREFTLAVIGLHDNSLTSGLLGTIRGLRPNLRLIVMGPDDDDETILAAIGAGAKAYLEAGASAQQVEQAIDTVSQGSIWAPRRVLSLFVERVIRPVSETSDQPVIHFTAREREVLRLLVAARSNREIARNMGIEERTVKAHLAKLMRKVGVENRIALSIHVVTQGIINKGAE